MNFDVFIFARKLQIQTGKLSFNSKLKRSFLDLLGDEKVIVCLISLDGIAAFKQHPELIEDRKVRHPDRELAKYFLENEEKLAAFLDGKSYRRFGSVNTSIEKFLEHTVSWDHRHIFFICVQDQILKGASESLQALIQNNPEILDRRKKNPPESSGQPFETDIKLEDEFLGNAKSCVHIRQLIITAAQNDNPVLILGETGTGKEVVARNIHTFSKRRNFAYVAVNCSAISSKVFESELFGHVKGAYTDATSDHEGLWESAHGGTLFLDEIGDLPYDHQATILRALQENVIYRVGSSKPTKVDARIIAATNRDIEYEALHEQNSFREDLFFRLNSFVIFTPSLKDHPEDVGMMAARFWNKFNSYSLSREVQDSLSYMNWPGNVRSLKHFLQKLHMIYGSESITVEQIQALHRQEVESYLAFNTSYLNRKKKDSNAEFEKAVHKMEFLLKAALYCENEVQKKKLLEEVRGSLNDII